MGKKKWAVRPQDRPADEKLRLVLEASGLSDEQLGAFLRREGIHEEHLRQWREAALGGLSGGGKTVDERSRERIRALEKELRRKDKALAEAGALLVLQKKVRALLGEEDDDTEPQSE